MPTDKKRKRSGIGKIIGIHVRVVSDRLGRVDLVLSCHNLSVSLQGWCVVDLGTIPMFLRKTAFWIFLNDLCLQKYAKVFFLLALVFWLVFPLNNLGCLVA